MILSLCSYLTVDIRELNGNPMYTYMTWKYWDSLKSDKTVGSLVIRDNQKLSVWRHSRQISFSQRKKILAQKPIPSGQHSGNMLREPIFNADFHLIHIFKIIPNPSLLLSLVSYKSCDLLV